MSKTRLNSIEDLDLKGNRVFIRTDFNIPLSRGEELHPRFLSVLPTIEYALNQKAKVIIGSHLGRPKNEAGDTKLSLEPFGNLLCEKLHLEEVLFVRDLEAPSTSFLISTLTSKKILLLENLRTYPGETEPSGSKKRIHLEESLSRLMDAYINDAFSSSHRDHASITGLPNRVKIKGEGFSMKKERLALDQLIDRSSSPVVFILGGGGKVKEKIRTISKLLDKVDIFLLGGHIGLIFLKADDVLKTPALNQEEWPAGSLRVAKDILIRAKERGKSILCPLDHVVVSKTQAAEPLKHFRIAENVTEGDMVYDIGPKTVEQFKNVLKKAKTVFWNGPLGHFEVPPFHEGTFKIGEFLVQCSSAFRVAGGGDTLDAIHKGKLETHFDYLSTGGGAALLYLEQGNLPGITALNSRI